MRSYYHYKNTIIRSKKSRRSINLVDNKERIIDSGSSYFDISLPEGFLYKNHSEVRKHGYRVGKMALQMGQALKLSSSQLEELVLLARFHDIGKIGIPDEILKKSGILTSYEYRIIQRHSQIGYIIALYSPVLSPIARLILNHHEHWDGNGYPQRLKGEEIPLLSRIVSIIDAYDAMTHNRSYRKAISQYEALHELKRFAGTQFDPELVRYFIKILQEKRPSP